MQGPEQHPMQHVKWTDDDKLNLLSARICKLSSKQTSQHDKITKWKSEWDEGMALIPYGALKVDLFSLRKQWFNISYGEWLEINNNIILTLYKGISTAMKLIVEGMNWMNHTFGAEPTSASYIGMSFLLTITKHAVLAISTLKVVLKACR
jgi:hypothetical protein